MKDNIEAGERKIIKKTQTAERADLLNKLPVSFNGWQHVSVLPTSGVSAFSDGTHIYYAKMTDKHELSNPFKIDSCTKWYDNGHSHITPYDELNAFYVASPNHRGEYETKYVSSDLVPFPTKEAMIEFNKLFDKLDSLEREFYVKGGNKELDIHEFSDLSSLIHDDKNDLYKNALCSKLNEIFKAKFEDIESNKRTYEQLLNNLKLSFEQRSNYESEIKACDEFLDRYKVAYESSSILLDRFIGKSIVLDAKKGRQPE